jgi:hypothetical protein
MNILNRLGLHRNDPLMNRCRILNSQAQNCHLIQRALRPRHPVLTPIGAFMGIKPAKPRTVPSIIRGTCIKTTASTIFTTTGSNKEKTYYHPGYNSNTCPLKIDTSFLLQ